MRKRVAKKVLRVELATHQPRRGTTHRLAWRFLIRHTVRGDFSTGRAAKWQTEHNRLFPPGRFSMSKYVLDLAGVARPAPDLLGWAHWFEWFPHRQIAVDNLPDGTYVSTVFLGLDHNFGFQREHAPVVFETAVCRREGSLEIIRRYSTRAEALSGHSRVVAGVLAGTYRDDDASATLDAEVAQA